MRGRLSPPGRDRGLIFENDPTGASTGEVRTLSLTSLSQNPKATGHPAGQARGGHGWDRPRERLTGLHAEPNAVSSKTATPPDILRFPMLSCRASPALARECVRSVQWMGGPYRPPARLSDEDGVAYAEAPSSTSGPRVACNCIPFRASAPVRRSVVYPALAPETRLSPKYNLN